MNSDLNMKGKALFFALIVCFLFPYTANASPCSLEELKKILLQISFDPEIETNKGLLNIIKNKYGQDMITAIEEVHPALVEAPDSNIDTETLSWIIKYIWSDQNKVTRFIPIVGDLSVNSVLEDSIAFVADNMFKLSHKVTPVFMNEEDATLFLSYAKENLYRILKHRNPSYTKEMLREYRQYFARYIYYNHNYLVKFDSVKVERPVIILLGHGTSEPNVMGIGGQHISIDELMVSFNKLNFPNNAIIKMQICFSGCRNKSLPLTVEEIKQHFLSNDIETLAGVGNNSFMDLFIAEFSTKFPGLNASFEGYVGAIMAAPQLNVLKTNGSLLSQAHAVQVTGTNGDIFLKKGEAKIKISR